MVTDPIDEGGRWLVGWLVVIFLGESKERRKTWKHWKGGSFCFVVRTLLDKWMIIDLSPSPAFFGDLELGIFGSCFRYL